MNTDHASIRLQCLNHYLHALTALSGDGYQDYAVSVAALEHNGPDVRQIVTHWLAGFESAQWELLDVTPEPSFKLDEALFCGLLLQDICGKPVADCMPALPVLLHEIAWHLVDELDIFIEENGWGRAYCSYSLSFKSPAEYEVDACLFDYGKGALLIYWLRYRATGNQGEV